VSSRLILGTLFFVLAIYEIRLANKRKEQDILQLLFLILCHGFCCGLLISRFLTDTIG
jgi:hypothetical protein